MWAGKRLGTCLAAAVATAALVAPPASADNLVFSASTKTHRHWTCVPNWGCRPYRVAGTVEGTTYANAVVVGARLYYSTAALSPDTVLVYTFHVRFDNGRWRTLCPRGVCQFDSLKRSPWPGFRAGASPLTVKFRTSRPRRVTHFAFTVQPLTEAGGGRWVGKGRIHKVRTHYSRCNCTFPR